MPSWRTELRKNYSDPLQKARDIVARYKSRGNTLPRQFRSGNDPLRQQENKDARKLYDWKQALKGLRFYKCSDELRDYLDSEMSGWRQSLKEVHTNPMQKAIGIVERYRLNGCLLPRQYKNGTDPHRIQENKDAQKLYNWKEALSGKRGKCSDAVRDYLDREISGWRADSVQRRLSGVSGHAARGVAGSEGADCRSSSSGLCAAVPTPVSGDKVSGDVGAANGEPPTSESGAAVSGEVEGSRKRRGMYTEEEPQPQQRREMKGEWKESEEEGACITQQIRMDSELLLQLTGGPRLVGTA